MKVIQFTHWSFVFKSKTVCYLCGQGVEFRLGQVVSTVAILVFHEPGGETVVIGGHLRVGGAQLGLQLAKLAQNGIKTQVLVL